MVTSKSDKLGRLKMVFQRLKQVLILVSNNSDKSNSIFFILRFWWW